MVTTQKIAGAIVGAAMLAFGQGALAQQAYPAKSVQVIVPWTPGQATDAAARTAADKLSAAMGQSFIVENKAGAGGTIGASYVARAKADGYTLLAGSTGSITTGPLLNGAPYSAKDFAPVSLIATVPYVLVTRSDFPAQSAQELVETLVKNPDKYTFASSGVGSIGHLTAELFTNRLGIKATHIPYNGSAKALTDVMSGEVTFMFDSPTSIASHVQSGKVRAYAVSSKNRSQTLPDVPTIAETTALKDFDLIAWIGLLAPAGTPDDVLDALNRQINSNLVGEEVQNRYRSLGIDLAKSTRADMARVIADENERVSKLLNAAGIKK
ncbi:Bug family tripartite tricarboxylate transporter substrate binding protein [Parapusillimonas granuli]|nr:tripartite tricarboxylate transporter substrate-binding protein [Parapusillimonas granuli]MBB5214871.1 tripartite-type tricarboxylate transporter receptor subunit TctC [Parapusillimonas granuli]MEB2399933.1 tripartite tricarboxylate transporter substrate-binding protein [Alcaligenaceae bacterium]